MKVIIEGVSQCAKNRVREHGNKFTILKQHSEEILLCTGDSIEDSAWFGWFEKQEIKVLDILIGNKIKGKE